MNERGFKMREEGYLNDLYYEDRPMRLVVPDPLQKADEQELEQSRKKNREMIMAIRKRQREMALHNAPELLDD
jgi:hypothetical protein